jgi:hypothetical protein
MKDLKPHLITFVIVVAGVLTANYVKTMLDAKSTASAE